MAAKPKQKPIDETAEAASFETRILNCVPSRDIDKDWTFGSAVGAGLVSAAPIPVQLDLRAPWWPIGDQGRTGSCVGWATADSLLRWHFVKSGRIGQNDRVSVRFIWVSAKETDEFNDAPTTFVEAEGTSLKAALDVARRYGTVTEAHLPFDYNVLYQGDARTFYAMAAQYKIASYIGLDRNPAAWRRWIAEQGPILVRLDVDRPWMDATATRGRLAVYDPTSASGGHAVSLVGYDANGFIVRNSWGLAWGDQGFAYASNAYAAAAFTESYGVTVT